MNLKQLDKDLTKIILTKNKLSTLSYDDKQYDILEDELHDLEDDFLEKHGEYLEKILTEIHDEWAPDTDVLLPTAYFANKYIDNGLNPDGTHSIDVAPSEGVYVEFDKYPGKDTRMVILPYPLRIALNINKKDTQIIWKAS